MHAVPALSLALLLIALAAPVQAGETATAEYVGGGITLLGIGLGTMVPPALDHVPEQPATFVVVFADDDVYGMAPMTVCIHQFDAIVCQGPFVGAYVHMGGPVERIQVWVHAVFVSESLDAGLGSLGSVTATFA